MGTDMPKYMVALDGMNTAGVAGCSGDGSNGNGSVSLHI